MNNNNKMIFTDRFQNTRNSTRSGGNGGDGFPPIGERVTAVEHRLGHVEKKLDEVSAEIKELKKENTEHFRWLFSFILTSILTPVFLHFVK